MVKIAVAGGSGSVAQEIIEVLAATKKHEILILSRKDGPTTTGTSDSGVSWVKTDYQDPRQLAQILQGVHTVLSFVTQGDLATEVQKNLIDASIQAGVKRFAPSEWASSTLEHMDWYAHKVEARRYLEEINKDEKKVLDYTLFQPGLFLNYFTHPYKSAKHLHSLEIPFDFNNRRALVTEGSENARITVTTVQDVAHVVARAIDYEGEWPVIGGIRGADLSVGQLLALGEKVRGGPFEIEKLKASSLKNNSWKSSWTPRLDHPSLAPDQVEGFSRIGLAGILLAVSASAFGCSDQRNLLLPDYKFTQPEEFLSQAWHGKP